jgi:hypothetical protein
VHLQADLEKVIDWATGQDVPWAFSLINAGAVYAPFRNRVEELDEIDWDAVAATDFRDPEVKEGKQAEFLVKRFVPWSLIERVGVSSEEVEGQAEATIAASSHQPPVDVLPRWYF